MQNLQTKFPATSPNIEYLSQFSLLDEDQLIEETEQKYQTEFISENYVFQLDEHKANEYDQPSRLNFQQFCQNILTNKIQKNSYLSVVLLKVMCLFFGQILEYLYVKTQMQQNHARRLISILGKQFKVYFFIKLFVLFILLYHFPLQTILLTVFLIVRNNDQIESQVNCLSLNIREMNQSFIELKIFILEFSSKYPSVIKQIQYQINHLVAQFSEQFDIVKHKSYNLLDRLEGVVFEITQNVKQKQLQQQFVQSNLFSLLIIHTKIKNMNSKLRYSIHLLKTLPNKINIVQDHLQDKKKNKVDLKQHQLYYFSYLSEKIEKLNIVNKDCGQTSTKRVDSLMRILQKEIAFRKLYQYQKKIVSDQKQKSQKQQQIQKQQTAKFVSSDKLQKNSVCFQDGNIQVYKPGDCSLIKQKLEMILLQKERKQKEARSKKQVKTIEQVFKFNIKDLKPQRISFGIGLIPPKRNLEAFYSD